MKKFWVIIYITSEFYLYEKIETLLTQFWVIIYKASEFNSYKIQKLYWLSFEK